MTQNPAPTLLRREDVDLGSKKVWCWSDGGYTNVVGLPFEVILPIFQKLHLIN